MFQPKTTIERKLDAQRKRLTRQNESPQVRETRLKSDAGNKRSLRKNESADQRTDRLKNQLDYQLSHYEDESADKRSSRLQRQLKYQLSHYEGESSDKRTSRFNRQQKYQARRCNNESSHNRTTRLSYQRLYKASKVRNINNTALNIARTESTNEVVDTLIDEHSVGSMEFLCSHCGAKFWESEKLSISTKDCIKFSLCCGQGKVVLPSLATPPELLIHLLTVLILEVEPSEIISEPITQPLRLLPWE